jgi:hypothetical protein
VTISRLAATLALFACAPPSTQPKLDPISAEETAPLFLFSHSPSGSGYDGHGFVIRREGRRPLGLTAFHVAGPVVTGPVDPVSPQATAWLRAIVDVPVVVRLAERLPIVGARTIDGTDSQHDVAAYTVIDFIDGRALELATDLPAVGDTVYVLALHVGDHPRSGPRRHPALVTTASDTQLRYRYLLSKNANFTSGAAVLDRTGRVVGLNVGTVGGGDDVSGIAVGVRSLRALLPD